jgi:hypothetical protein
MPPQVAGHPAQQVAMPVQPIRYRPQLAADLVPGKDIEYTGLDDAFLAHCRLRRLRGGLGFSGMTPKHIPETAGLYS